MLGSRENRGWVDNGDGTDTFPVYFHGVSGVTENFLWKIEVADGELVDLTELVS